MTTNIARQPSGVPSGGQFAASGRGEAAVALPGQADPFPRRPDGTIDADAAIEQGYITGFSAAPFPEPKTVSLHGHWDGNTLVIESIYDGDVPDERPDNGHWDCGLWASSATGSSDAEIAATMLDEYDESDSIRVALTDDDMTPDDPECSYCENPATSVDNDEQDTCDEHADTAPNRCSADECDEAIDDNEGYDGYCGTHADLIEQHPYGHKCECAMSESSMNACPVHGPDGSMGRCPVCPA